MLDKEIAESEYFRIENGPVLPSLLALRAYLRTIPYPVFEHHVNVERNDFANWVDHVFAEKELAERLRQCKSREQMVWAIDDAFAEMRMAKVIAEQEIKPMVQKQVPGMPDASDGVTYEDDALFTKETPAIVSTNERVNVKYEQVAKQMQEAMLDPTPKDVERHIEQIKNRHQDLLARISEARRQGKDLLIAALVLKPFLSKLKYATITREDSDFKAAERVLDEAEVELKEAIDMPVLDVKKEILAMVAAQDAAEAKK